MRNLLTINEQKIKEKDKKDNVHLKSYPLQLNEIYMNASQRGNFKEILLDLQIEAQKNLIELEQRLQKGILPEIDSEDV